MAKEATIVARVSEEQKEYLKGLGGGNISAGLQALFSRMPGQHLPGPDPVRPAPAAKRVVTPTAAAPVVKRPTYVGRR